MFCLRPGPRCVSSIVARRLPPTWAPHGPRGVVGSVGSVGGPPGRRVLSNWKAKVAAEAAAKRTAGKHPATGASLDAVAPAAGGEPAAAASTPAVDDGTAPPPNSRSGARKQPPSARMDLTAPDCAGIRRKHQWADMTPETRRLWQQLGWNESNWGGDAEPPPSDEKAWSDLTATESATATRLGYTASSWDEEEPGGFDDSDAGGGGVPFLKIALGLALAAGTYFAVQYLTEQARFSKVQVTDREKAKLVEFMSSVIEKDPSIHPSWFKSTPDRRDEVSLRRFKPGDRKQKEKDAGQAVLQQLRDVFVEIYKADPGAESNDSDEMLITAMGWRKFCADKDEAKPGHWSDMHGEAIDALFRAADLDSVFRP
eukprot:COSAG02_NODE_5617_length_4179_cov_6.227451_1_plen_370_part_00